MDLNIDWTISDSSEFSSSDVDTSSTLGTSKDNPVPGTSKQTEKDRTKDLRPAPAQDKNPFNTFIELLSILARKQRSLKNLELD